MTLPPDLRAFVDAETWTFARTRALPTGPDREWLRQHLQPLLGLEAARASREENYAAWTRFLELMAARRPTVLVFEDLHWAGEAMLDFFDHLLSAAPPAPLLIVATARPELLQHEGALTGGGERLNRLTLSPLGSRRPRRSSTTCSAPSLLPTSGHGSST